MDGIMGRRKYPESKRNRYGAWLRFLRKKAKLSLDELSRITGIPAPTLSLWERTGKLGNAGRILALAHALGVKVNALLHAQNEPKMNVTDAYRHEFYNRDRQKRAGFPEE